MRHASRIVERLALGSRDVALVHATLMVVERTHGQLDWEVVANTVEVEPVAHDRHDVSLRVIDGVTELGALVTRTLHGTAVLVRTVDRTFVLRGDSTLAGFDVAELTGDEPGS